MKQFITLIKREFWEHKTSTFYAPIVISFGFVLLVWLSEIKAQTDVTALKMLSFGLSFGTMPSILVFVLPLLIVIYAMNSLYEERKNKSLLFWRSMPVSDTKTVLSKVFFGVIAIPMLFIITWLIVTSFSFVINYGMTHFFYASSASSSKHSFKFLFGLVSSVSVGFLVLSIMMLPYYTYLTFISSISTRVPFLIAILPFIALAFVNMLIPESVVIYDYIFMPFELAIRSAIEVTRTMLEKTNLIGFIIEKLGFSMQEYHDFFNNGYQEPAEVTKNHMALGIKVAPLALRWDTHEIFTLFASMIASATFIVLAIFARKRIQAV